MTSTGRRTGDGFAKILFMLFVAGYSANYFTSLIPVLRETGRYPTGSLEVAFALYALGLLPSLLSGGALADRFSPRLLALIGTCIAAVGNLDLLLVTVPLATDVGRFIVGIGVGLAISAGNAWASRVRPVGGGAHAGVALTAGFATGPLVVGIIATLAPTETKVILAGTTTLVLAAVVVVLLLGMKEGPTAGHHVNAGAAERASLRELRPVFARALPMGLWVFASATVALVTLTSRLPDEFSGPLVTGVIAFVSLGSGVVTQLVARRLNTGAKAGIVGAGIATVAFLLAALAGDPVAPVMAFGCAIVFGMAYGMCLRAGLTDIEELCPPSARGLVGGIFYVTTYLGFGLPALLVALEPAAGPAVPLFAVALVAAGVTLLRVVQVRERT